MIRFQPARVGPEWFDDNVPCTRACPVLTNAGQYVTAIAEGLDDLSYRIARMPNPFPSICGRVCAAPCEDACRRGDLDHPIAIRALKRFACERAGVESPHAERMWRSAVDRRPRLGRRAAIVGAGPAGLACAHDLAAYGYDAVVLDAADRPGGMMVLGIPTYRLRREILQAEIRAILGLGVELRLGARLGADFDLRSLRDDGFEAVFLATGAMRSRDLQIPGVELDGVLKAVDFLINANAGYRVDLGDRVIVVGGGNVALDVARTALREPVGAETAAFDVARMAVRLGARDVRVVALEARHEMPAHEFEIEEAEAEGIAILHRLGPHRILGNGHVTGLETTKVASVFDPDGRFNPRYVEGTESTLECDSVILAIGQAPDLSWIAPDDGIVVSPRGTIAVDAETLATTADGVYAGGDAAFGPRNLIDAIADGRRAAASIHARLSGSAGAAAGDRQRSMVRRLLPVTAAYRPVDAYDALPRVEIPTEPTNRRIGVPEVELGFTEEQARVEASRCLQCFLNIELDASLCILCGGCVDVCPEYCIRIVPAEEIWGAGATDLTPGQSWNGTGVNRASALVIQEDFCIRCALCVDRCPTDALSLARWTEARSRTPHLEPIGGSSG